VLAAGALAQARTTALDDGVAAQIREPEHLIPAPRHEIWVRVKIMGLIIMRTD
jgi:hypothetical protein